MVGGLASSEHLRVNAQSNRRFGIKNVLLIHGLRVYVESRPKVLQLCSYGHVCFEGFFHRLGTLLARGR